jgi:hypothetical protein
VSIFGFLAATSSVASRATGGGAPPAVPGLGSPTHFGHPAILETRSPGSLAAAGVGCPSGTTCAYSYNWGGYVVYKSTYVVTKISASWTVPTISGVVGSTCPDSTQQWLSDSVWIGIDGYGSGTVEQTGTSSDCYYGAVNYYAWYEFYPAGSVTAFAVSPGDSIKATVSYVGMSGGHPTFKATITDTTSTSTATSPTTAVSGATRTSAEWISEAPYFDGILGLTHVGTVKFTSASATIGGVSGSISHWTGNIYWVLMVDYNFPFVSTLTYAKDQPSATSSGGKTFTMKWLTDGP